MVKGKHKNFSFVEIEVNLDYFLKSIWLFSKDSYNYKATSVQPIIPVKSSALSWAPYINNTK
jgi:hypothetical protein